MTSLLVPGRSVCASSLNEAQLNLFYGFMEPEARDRRPLC